MSGLILMTLLFAGVLLYAILLYKDRKTSLKELIFVFGSLLVIAISILIQFINI